MTCYFNLRFWLEVHLLKDYELLCLRSPGSEDES